MRPVEELAEMGWCDELFRQQREIKRRMIRGTATKQDIMELDRLWNKLTKIHPEIRKWR